MPMCFPNVPGGTFLTVAAFDLVASGLKRGDGGIPPGDYRFILAAVPI